MNILLLGANGQVGFELLRSLAPLGKVHAATRNGLLAGHFPCLGVDLGEPSSVTSLLQQLRPELIVNAAAYTAVDRAEQEPELAHRINAEAVGELGAWAAAQNVPILHYSTDYVFPGNGTEPWREDDPTAPLGVYGRSKLAGEQQLRTSGARHLILRTAWVYASRGHNFLRTMLRLCGERNELRIVDDQIGSPTPARLIAAVSAQLLGRMQEGDGFTKSASWGTFHLTSSGATSWCGFARAIVMRAERAGLIERSPKIIAIRSEDYPTPAQRPAHSILDTQRLCETFGLQLPDWSTGLDLVLSEIAAR